MRPCRAPAACPPLVDLVTVSVKVPDHYLPVSAEIEAGKHVYCEWPLGRNTEEAVRMLEAVKRKESDMPPGCKAKCRRRQNLVNQGLGHQVEPDPAQPVIDLGELRLLLGLDAKMRNAGGAAFAHADRKIHARIVKHPPWPPSARRSTPPSTTRCFP